MYDALLIEMLFLTSTTNVPISRPDAALSDPFLPGKTGVLSDK